MEHKSQYCSLLVVAQLIVYVPRAGKKIIKNHNNKVNRDGWENIIISTKNLNALLIEITLSSTKESIEGLGCIARNCAFFDISASFSKSFFFSLVFSAKQWRMSSKNETGHSLLKIHHGRKRSR